MSCITGKHKQKHLLTIMMTQLGKLLNWTQFEHRIYLAV